MDRTRVTLPLLVGYLLLISYSLLVAQEAETLPPLSDKSPSNFTEMWAGFDPRAEPLEIETLKEWEQDEVVLRIVRFRIGVFKGKQAKLAAVYGFPKRLLESGERIPGLLQIHGGGQYADSNACLTNAKRGYATLSIAWAGRINSPEYRVTPSEVKLFWDGKTDDPNYKQTTDWGAVDGYHAPGRNQGNSFPSAKPAEWTLDSVESPRNSGWFLCALAARRALTFLERQPQVDAERIGVYGHSMGGKLTVMTAFDSRVKAAAPSCGGISDRDNASTLFRSTVGDDVSLKEVSCPIMFLSPANDFHGRIGDLPTAIGEIQSQQWRVTCSPHGNHQDLAEYEVATQLWFDQHLQNKFVFPKTPNTKLQLESDDGVPSFSVTPDPSKSIVSVDVFYTQDGRQDESPKDFENTKHRFWRFAKATESDGQWNAKLPIADAEKPLWVYANVLYSLESPVTGAGYYYGTYTAESFNLSSALHTATPAELAEAQVKAALKPTQTIETFAGDWRKEWFTYKNEGWARTTNKLYDPLYRVPSAAGVGIEVLVEEDNVLVIKLDGWACELELEGSEDWQKLDIRGKVFRNLEGESIPSFADAKQLTICPSARLRPKRGSDEKPKTVGGEWKGAAPKFRNLRWVVLP